MNGTTIALYILLILVVIFLTFALFAKLLSFLVHFTKELKYLNSEIERTYGSERKTYIRKRRKLWLSLIPFVKY